MPFWDLFGGEVKMNWSAFLDFVRGFVRPYVAYLFSAVFAGLAVYLTIRFADADLAKIIVVGFVEIVGIVIGFYFGQRQRPS